jgi:hypothetical protein
MSHEVSYSVPEVDGLVEASKIVNRLATEAAFNQPICIKLLHVKKYIQERQVEVLASVLNPEVQ